MSSFIDGAADLVLTGNPGRDWILIKTLLYRIGVTEFKQVEGGSTI
jgi:DNA helicase-2/ATP-dependent DNA helicase PcrA